MPKKSNSFTEVQRPLEVAPGRCIQIVHYTPVNPKACVIVAPAMAVAHSFYAPFCQWLAEQGFAVIGFDYYGIGASKTIPLRNIDTSVTDWAQLDAVAVIAAAKQHYPELKRIWMGHSISGQIFGMIPNRNDIDHLVTVATGAGYWRLMSGSFKYLSLVLWNIITPVAIPLAGFYPGKSLKIIGDVPAGAMRQWRAWCLHPHYLVGKEFLYDTYAEVTTPITALSFTDDEMISAANAKLMHDFYCNAPQQRLRFTPQELGVKHIGHFGIFRRSCQHLWPELLLTKLSQIAD